VLPSALHPAHDVVGPDGRKVSGNAQYRQRDAVVQHGSLTFSTNPERHCACFTGAAGDADQRTNGPDPDAFDDRVGGIDEYADIDRTEVVDALSAALTEGPTLTKGRGPTRNWPALATWPNENTRPTPGRATARIRPEGRWETESRESDQHREADTDDEADGQQHRRDDDADERAAVTGGLAGRTCRSGVRAEHRADGPPDGEAEVDRRRAQRANQVRDELGDLPDGVVGRVGVGAGPARASVDAAVGLGRGPAGAGL